MDRSVDTKYAHNGDLSIAYQVVGEGPIDVVFVPGFMSHVELNWDYAFYATFLERMASMSRLVILDKRGSGGLAVHLAARVMAEAGPSEVFASSTVRDLTVGGAFEFEDRGQRALKGVPGAWSLYAVGAPSGQTRRASSTRLIS